MDVTVAISTFGRADTVLETVGNLVGVPTLVNVNDGDSQLRDKLKAKGCRTVLTDGPELFWQGMASLVRHSLTEWLLITSDEDPVIVEELPALTAFAESKNAGVVCAPVWGSGLVKPWPESWAQRMADDDPPHPSHFHDVSGYISGTLLHRETALKHLPLIEKIASSNQYVLIYTVPALVALMGMTRNIHTYPRAVTTFGEQLPGQQEVPGSDYWEPGSRRIQHEHLGQFFNIVSGINAEYGEKLREARVYEKRGWLA
jgi:hypothetical protein